MRLAADAAHQFGGIELDRSKPLSFRLDGRKIAGFAGDTVLSARSPPVSTPMACSIARSSASASASRRWSWPSAASLCRWSAPRRSTVSISRPSVRARASVSGSRIRCAIASMISLTRLGFGAKPDTTLTADLLVIGAGVAGLAAADAAAAAGHSVILVERRPWLGGDARYFGAVGDDETPEALTTRLAAQLAARANVNASHSRGSLRPQRRHRDPASGRPRRWRPAGRVVAVTAQRILIATGATQRLPVFPAIAADCHLGDRRLSSWRSVMV